MHAMCLELVTTPCMQSRCDEHLKVCSSNLVTLVLNLRDLRQASKLAWTFSKRWSMLVPGHPWNLQAKSTSFFTCVVKQIQAAVLKCTSTCMIISATTGTIMDPQNSCPTPKCHVWAWSGQASSGPRAGTTLKADGLKVGSAAPSVLHRSCSNTKVMQKEGSHKSKKKRQASPLHRWQTRCYVKLVRSWWHLPDHGFAAKKMLGTPASDKHVLGAQIDMWFHAAGSRCQGQSPRSRIHGLDRAICLDDLWSTSSFMPRSQPGSCSATFSTWPMSRTEEANGSAAGSLGRSETSDGLVVESFVSSS